MCIDLKIVKRYQHQFYLENKVFEIFSIGDANPLTIPTAHAATNDV